MKVINVPVIIQMDITKNKDTQEQISETLKLLNTIISMSELESQPQIFVNESNKFIATQTKVTNVAQFIDLSRLHRGVSKRLVDKFIKLFNINNSDLIADIYGSLGI